MVKSSTCKAVSLWNTLDDPCKITEAVEKLEREHRLSLSTFTPKWPVRNKPCLGTRRESICRRWNTYACPNKRRLSSSTGDAFLCDVEMTGPYNGILGWNAILLRNSSINYQHDLKWLEDDEGQLSACLIDIDDKTGKANRFNRFASTE